MTTLKKLSLNVTAEPKNAPAVFERLSKTAVNMAHITDSAVVSVYEDDDLSDIEGEEYYDEYTLFKVFRTLTAGGLDERQANAVILGLQNAGIVFREKRLGS